MSTATPESVNVAAGLLEALAELNNLAPRLATMRRLDESIIGDERFDQPGTDAPDRRDDGDRRLLARATVLQSTIDAALDKMQGCPFEAPPKGWAKWYDSVTKTWWIRCKHGPPHCLDGGGALASCPDAGAAEQ